MLTNLYKIYGPYYFKVWALHLIVILCLITTPANLIIWSLVTYVLFAPVMQLITHDYICHEYIKPRNYIIDTIVLLLWYMNGQTVSGKRNYHAFHHCNWTDPTVDPTSQTMLGTSWWKYVLFFNPPKTLSIPYVESALLANNPIVQKLDPYADKIYWLSIVILFVVLPLEWFIIFRIYTFWLMMVLGRAHDWYFHQRHGNDTGLLFILYVHSSWHIQHHKDWRTETYGPWPWLNPAYWVRKLVFDPWQSQQFVKGLLKS